MDGKVIFKTGRSIPMLKEGDKVILVSKVSMKSPERIVEKVLENRIGYPANAMVGRVSFIGEYVIKLQFDGNPEYTFLPIPDKWYGKGRWVAGTWLMGAFIVRKMN